MSKKIKINKYSKDFASVSFLNSEKKIYHACFKLFSFLRKKVKGIAYNSYISISNSQYKKLITLKKGGPAPADIIDDSIGQSRSNEIYYEKANKKDFFDYMDEEFLNNFEDDIDDIDDWYPFDKPHRIIVTDDELDDILKNLFNKLEEDEKDILNDNKKNT